MSNEQWKSEGDCTKCRRQKYCSIECKANREATDKFINNLVKDYAVKAFIEKTVKGGAE